MALSLAGGLGLSVGTTTGAVADTGSGSGGSGDGALHLIPEVIANEGASAGGSSEFPITARLFLPALQDRAEQAKQSAAAVTHAATALTFERAKSTSASEAFAETRGRLFQDYSHQVLPGSRRTDTAHGADLWLVVLLAAGVPLTALAAFLGLRMASRKASRHA